MKIVIIGAGTVGTATGSGFRRFGHEVVFYDIDPKRLDKLELMGFHITDNLNEEHTDVFFVTTPECAAEGMVRRLPCKHKLVVIRSSVLPGTTRRLREETGGHIAVNPEFLRDATATQDFINPARIVYSSCCLLHRELLEDLYRPFLAPMIHVDNPTEAEMVKYASNLFLATAISYWNEIADICRKLGVNSHAVGKTAAMDPRIPSYGASQHGEPFGGKCLPHNLDVFLPFCRGLSYTPILLQAVESVNKNTRPVRDVWQRTY